MSTAEISTLTQQYKDLHHDVNNLRQTAANVQQSLHRIEQGLFGDEKISHAGVIKVLDDYKFIVQTIREDVENFKIEKQTAAKILSNDKWWITGIASCSAVISGGVVSIFHHFFNK